jgi:hypothetical protein
MTLSRDGAYYEVLKQVQDEAAAKATKRQANSQPPIDGRELATEAEAAAKKLVNKFRFQLTNFTLDQKRKLAEEFAVEYAKTYRLIYDFANRQTPLFFAPATV